jgi:WD40 repeat protein
VWKNTLISGGEDWTMRLWDLKSSSLNPYRVFTIDYVSQFCLHVKNDYVFGSGFYSMLQWDMITLSLVKEFAGHESIVVSITSIDDYVLSGSYDQTVKKWKISSGELIYNFDEHSGPVENIFISDFFLFVGCMDGTVNMWLVEEQAIIAIVQPSNFILNS